jgi:hypothetical protein
VAPPPATPCRRASCWWIPAHWSQRPLLPCRRPTPPANRRTYGWDRQNSRSLRAIGEGSNPCICAGEGVGVVFSVRVFLRQVLRSFWR